MTRSRFDHGTENVKAMRENAMRLMARTGHHMQVWAGEDILNLDELCQKLAKALKTLDQEDVAGALFAYGEFYDR